ncbi:MAG: HAD family hydrolase [Chloroflexota bacterium]
MGHRYQAASGGTPATSPGADPAPDIRQGDSAAPIRAVIFDRDGTLLRFNYGAAEELERRVHAIAPTLPPAAASSHWMAWPGPWPRLVEEEPAFWRLFWQEFANRHALPPEATARLLEIGDFYHTCFAAYPDARGCLEELRRRGLKLAVLTNFELPSIDRTLRYAGIDPSLFDVLLSSSATGITKPDVRAYLGCAEALGLEPAACLFVDDRSDNVDGARRAGMRAVLIDRAGNAPPSEHAIRDLRQLCDLL